jgi:hypothetical protein
MQFRRIESEAQARILFGAGESPLRRARVQRPVSNYRTIFVSNPALSWDLSRTAASAMTASESPMARTVREFRPDAHEGI